MSKRLILITTIACYALGTLLLLLGGRDKETAGFCFILAGCLGSLTWSVS